MFSFTENIYKQNEGLPWLLFIAATLCLLMSVPQLPSPFGPGGLRVIYGNDERRDTRELAPTSSTRQWARSVAMMVDRNAIKSARNGDYEFTNQETLKLSMANSGKTLCSSEPFAQQPVFDGFCSAFLVAPQIMVTAAHCVSDSTCGYVAFVFGVEIEGDSSRLSHVKRSDLYFCKRVLVRKKQASGLDFAIIEMDRLVEGRTPLLVRKLGKVAFADELVLIGNPLGLPTKVAARGKVLDDASPQVFRAAVDSYGGQSGSPVFGVTSGLVEGILVRGKNDFEKTPASCFVSKRCAKNTKGCDGEVVVRATSFSHFLNLSPG